MVVDQDRSAGRAPRFATMLAMIGCTVLACVAVLAAIMVYSLDLAGTQLALVGNSQDQLLLATRIESALQQQVSGKGQASTEAAGLIESYRASIRAEERLTGVDSPASREESDATRFAQFAAYGRRGHVDLVGLNRLTRSVVLRERGEVADVAVDAGRLQQRASAAAVGLVVLLAGVLGVAGIALYRLAVRPIVTLRTAAMRVGTRNAQRVVPSGPLEIRELAVAFNGMADRIGAQHEELEQAVSERTAELQERHAELAEIDRSRRLFFSKVSHELRTPVAVMRGEAEVALRDPGALRESAGPALEHIIANADFLQRRLDDLLGLARSDQGRLTLSFAPLDLAELAREALAVAAPFARSSEVMLAGSGLDRAVIVDGDRLWLRQAVLAAIDNAVKFSTDVPVRLRLVRGKKAAALILLDRGPGIRSEDLARIFDPYVQTDEGRRRGGSGLGLSLARWTMEQHEGTISARTRRNGGLAIVMQLEMR